MIKSVWVLGSNSLVAQSICIELAKKGCERFYLISRDKEKSKCFANFLMKNKQVQVNERIVDLNFQNQKNEEDFYKVDDYDLYLITAGFLGNNDLAKIDFEEAKNIIYSNYFGIIPWINAIATPERINKSCRLWVFTSVSSDRGRPSNYFYGSAKAGLQNFCEGLMTSCYGKPFSVRIIKAGYMATPMTIGKVPNFLCIKTSDVAKILLKNNSKRGVEYLPWFWGPIMMLIRIMPNFLVSRL
tara:strand:+ start:101 stop:826 length:726 start_codon:yes stop_codon:yes gene_type:complete